MSWFIPLWCPSHYQLCSNAKLSTASLISDFKQRNVQKYIKTQLLLKRLFFFFCFQFSLGYFTSNQYIELVRRWSWQIITTQIKITSYKTSSTFIKTCTLGFHKSSLTSHSRNRSHFLFEGSTLLANLSVPFGY